jgi:hypothetical protein
MSSAILCNEVPSPNDALPEARITAAKWESLLVICAVVVLFVVNLLTCNFYPSVWRDEISFSEPAINLAHSGTFSTVTWPFQPENTFWAVNTPLYSWVLTAWLKVFPATVLGVRSLNYVLFGITSFLLWTVSLRLGLASTPLSRILLVATVHFGAAISLAYRCSRPDVLGMLCLLLLALVLSAKSSPRKSATLLLLGAITPWVGLQVGLYAGLACFLAWLILRAISFTDVLLAAAAIGAGTVALVAFLAWHHALGFYMNSIHFITEPTAHSAGSSGNWFLSHLRTAVQCYKMDFSLVPVLACVLFYLFIFAGRLQKPVKLLACYVLALYLIVPAVFTFTGHFSPFYGYMIYIPLVFGLFALRSVARIKSQDGKWSDSVFMLAIGAAMLVGLPMRLALPSACCHIVPRQVIRDSIQTRVQPEDVVLCEPTVYFEARQTAKHVLTTDYFEFRKFSESQKAAVSVIIIKPESLEFFTKFFGGQWRQVSDPFGDSCSPPRISQFPPLEAFLRRYFSNSTNERYQVCVYRRSIQAPAAND